MDEVTFFLFFSISWISFGYPSPKMISLLSLCRWIPKSSFSFFPISFISLCFPYFVFFVLHYPHMLFKVWIYLFEISQFIRPYLLNRKKFETDIISITDYFPRDPRDINLSDQNFDHFASKGRQCIWNRL